MLTSVDDLVGAGVRFTNPVQIDKCKLDRVYVALDSKPLLMESPKMTLKKAQDVQSHTLTFMVKDETFHRLLEHIDNLIHKDATRHRKDYELQKSLNDDEFRAKLLTSTKGIETRFFLSSKKEAEPNIESKNVNKILQDACVRLICRLDGYSIDLSKKVVRPLWNIQQCLVSNQINNPVGNDYCFLDDNDDLLYYSD